MDKKVVVLGGGVAGLSAAHELIRAGYEVDVYEARADLGGKARSQYVPATGRNGRADLPGEHGFRFYPSFYKHLIETMRGIPLDPARPSGKTVADNLRACSEAGCAPADGLGVRRFLRRRPEGATDLVGTVEMFFSDLGASPIDMAYYAQRILRYFVSCERRRNEKYESISWWQFIGADRYSPTMQRYLRAMPRIMVAMDPRYASARTIGNISMQLIGDYARNGAEADRTMIGPTTEVWIEPWRVFLKARGVRFHTGRPVVGFDFDKVEGALSGVRVQGERDPVRGDYYVAAMPLEVIVTLITDEMAERDPAEIGRLKRVRDERRTECGEVVKDFETKMVDWMVGAQFFLREDIALPKGHLFFPDSPWALSAIAQAPFWNTSGAGLFRDRFGDGEVGGVLSVDISDWNQPGKFVNKPAKLCSKEEILKEVWGELKDGINRNGEEILTDKHLYRVWNLDQDIEFSASNGGLPVNRSPLLVHPPGSWECRPGARTGIRNLMLASDYVRTETILACMEGANEAARHAVRAILESDERDPSGCEVWPLREISAFDRAKEIDHVAFTARLQGDRALPESSFFEGGSRSRPASLDEVRRMERRLVEDPISA
jgi:uncharacterized protein with NAD-binding domain and iron-sulfur cluster